MAVVWLLCAAISLQGRCGNRGVCALGSLCAVSLHE